MSQTNAKSLIVITFALITFSVCNAQTIRRSSISAIGGLTSNDANISSHSIGRMYFANISIVEIPVTNDDSDQLKTTVAPISENSNVEFGNLITYPNPAINNIHFAFQFPEAGKVNVDVYNAVGQKLSSVYHNDYEAGKDAYQIDLSTYSTGIYFLSINLTSAKDGQLHTITQKFQVIR